MIRDPSLYAAGHERKRSMPWRQPESLAEELDMLQPTGLGNGEPIALGNYEITIAMLLRAGQAHYSPILKQLYFWSDLSGATLGILRAAYTGASMSFKPTQLVLDRHGYFRCACKVGLPDPGYAAVAVALRLSGIRLLFAPNPINAIHTEAKERWAAATRVANPG